MTGKGDTNLGGQFRAKQARAPAFHNFHLRWLYDPGNPGEQVRLLQGIYISESPV